MRKASKGKGKGKAMSETEYVDALARRLNRSRAEVKRELAIQSEVIAQGLRAKGAVRTHLGAVKARHVPARKGGTLVRNPFTGQMVKAKAKPASKRIRLAPSKKFRSLL
jgi:nucleoid DNA-binding protein